MGKTFILAGNGSYGNKGCEAIVRGTTKIIRKFFKNPSFQCYSTFESDGFFEKQSSHESDRSVMHKMIYRPKGTASLAFRALGPLATRIRQKYEYKDTIPALDDAAAVLSVGGDTYALDWGIPRLYTDLNYVVIRKNKPLIIWGASIGPFNQNPDYEDYILNHLKNVNGLFIREPESIKYLKKNGVQDNIYHVGDPAFVMDPSKPDPDLIPAIEDDAIGMNLSTLMAGYITNGDRERWMDIAARLIEELHRRFERPIYLIPHVTRPVPTDNDYIFLKNALQKSNTHNNELHLVPPDLSAAESKWVIGNMSVFLGSRMHANIAALSSCVPTLSLAYSIKAKGINIDIFGSNDYCLQPEEITVEAITGSLSRIIEDETNIRRKLHEEIPKVQERAYNAGKYLKDILEEL